MVLANKYYLNVSVKYISYSDFVGISNYFFVLIDIQLSIIPQRKNVKIEFNVKYEVSLVF